MLRFILICWLSMLYKEYTWLWLSASTPIVSSILIVIWSVENIPISNERNWEAQCIYDWNYLRGSKTVIVQRHSKKMITVLFEQKNRRINKTTLKNECFQILFHIWDESVWTIQLVFLLVLATLLMNQYQRQRQHSKLDYHVYSFSKQTNTKPLSNWRLTGKLQLRLYSAEHVKEIIWYEGKLISRCSSFHRIARERCGV